MKLKRVWIAALAALLLLQGGANAEPRDYVRLHVIADSDAEDAQALKLKVRDACLACAGMLLDGCESADAAWETLNAHLDALLNAATEAARAGGWTGGVSAETGVFDFPDRTYGDMRVPAGAYRAVRVTIGRGAGRNWWCVLYPSLCVPEALPDDEPVTFYSAILRWLSALFGNGDAAEGGPCA